MRSLLILSLLALAQSTAAQVAEYDLRIDADNRELLHVEAKIPIGRRFLSIGNGRAHGENSWGSYVRELRADGRRPRAAGENAWRLRGRPAGRIKLSYEVDLSHQDVPFPYGHYGATYLREDCVYLTTSAVLIVSDRVDKALVRFHIPEDWRASTPWAKASYRSPEYRVLGRRELLGSMVLLGTHQERRLEVDGVDITVAVGNDHSGAHDLLVEPLRRIIEATTGTLGELPHQRYLVVVNRSVHRGEDGGTGLNRGVSLLLPEQKGSDLDETWAHALTHEFVHMWNGIGMRPAEATGEWFNEGVTDYLAALLTGRSGLAGRNYALRYLTVMYDSYRKQAGELSLMAGGERKGQEFYLIYGGGMAFGFLLDEEIRRGSQFEFGIEELMRRMYDEFGGEREGYRVADIERIAGELANRDLSELFDRYVEGEETIPLAPSLERIGLKVTKRGNRISIRRIPTADAGARRLRGYTLGSRD